MRTTRCRLSSNAIHAPRNSRNWAIANHSATEQLLANQRIITQPPMKRKRIRNSETVLQHDSRATKNQHCPRRMMPSDHLQLKSQDRCPFRRWNALTNSLVPTLKNCRMTTMTVIAIQTNGLKAAIVQHHDRSALFPPETPTVSIANRTTVSTMVREVCHVMIVIAILLDTQLGTPLALASEQAMSILRTRTNILNLVKALHWFRINNSK